MSMYCEPLLAALKECLLQSDCVVKQGHLPSECLKDHTKELPEQCLSLRQATFECKRGMLDMRKRFRGNNAGAVAQRIKEGSAKTEPDAEPASTST
ncbi:cytochrome c oxidase assembly protein PET191-domain-containing protein [Irpex rosettiformis]|uniref:Cytochrome c oxidase assembly protein PET191-domain-containing protein n=1 Tax=Irpex rosettiformis TaxID=378272 RepID=A0ACB8UEQ3_9APHY|nr:cytochrome c oxidase assembly protein PET191-domain-containing protein [Irpex rosettiformis]